MELYFSLSSWLNPALCSFTFSCLCLPSRERSLETDREAELLFLLLEAGEDELELLEDFLCFLCFFWCLSFLVFLSSLCFLDLVLEVLESED